MNNTVKLNNGVTFLLKKHNAIVLLIHQFISLEGNSNLYWCRVKYENEYKEKHINFYYALQ